MLHFCKINVQRVSFRILKRETSLHLEIKYEEKDKNGNITELF